jgi:DNA-binding transcriptional regulator YbjK
MTENGYSPDRSGAVVTATMVLLALLGVATVFHDPIAALFVTPPAAAEAPPAAR